MCIGVIACHFWNPPSEGNILSDIIDAIRNSAVHSFTLMAFFFSARTIESQNWDCIYCRIIRLLRPFLIWPIIMFVMYNTISIIVRKKIAYDYMDLGAQYFMGHTGICGVMYYNWIIILITMLYSTIFFHYSKKQTFFFLGIVCCITSPLILYGKHYDILSILPYEMRYSLGRLIELYPTAFLGLLLSHINFQNIKDRLAKSEIFHLFYLVLIYEGFWILLAYHEHKYLFSNKNFGYANPEQIIIATLLFIIGYFFKGNSLSEKIRNNISFIAKYTMGIYCVHFIVGLYTQVLFFKLGMNVKHTFSFSIIVFIISFICVYSMSKLPWKWCRDITN